jgi:hypothetical protein
MKEINNEVKKPKQFFNPNPHAYASEMKEYDHWIFSQLKMKPDGTWSKPPCNAAGYYTDGTDENNWLSFEKAFEICKANPDRFFGIGFCISSACPIKGIDVDHVYDPEKGWNQQALEEIKIINTRVEWSPSHTGVHIFFTCPIMLESGKKTQPDGTGREMYFEKHYLTVTGEVVDGFPETINEVDPELLTQLHENWFPDKKEVSTKNESFEVVQTEYDNNKAVQQNENQILDTTISDIDILQKCRKGRDKVKFEKLYNNDWKELGYGSQSEADEALLYRFAQHTKNIEQVIRLFSGSLLFDEKCHGSDYLRNSAVKAINLVNENPFNRYFVNKAFIIKRLADEIMSEYRFVTMQDTKEVFIYENGVYHANGRDRILQIAQLKLQNYYSPDRCNNTATYIATATMLNRELFNTSKTIINLKNKLYDLENGSKTHTPYIRQVYVMNLAFLMMVFFQKSYKFVLYFKQIDIYSNLALHKKGILHRKSKLFK